MKCAIFIDDERLPTDVNWIEYNIDQVEWIVVRTFAQFENLITEMVESGSFDNITAISFDHDLMDFDSNGNEFTGYTCINFLAQVILSNDLPVPICYFHTKNPCGKQNMQAVLTSLYRIRG